MVLGLRIQRRWCASGYSNTQLNWASSFLSGINVKRKGIRNNEARRIHVGHLLCRCVDFLFIRSNLHQPKPNTQGCSHLANAIQCAATSSVAAFTKSLERSAQAKAPNLYLGYKTLAIPLIILCHLETFPALAIHGGIHPL